MSILAVIPARHASSRFPGKPLAPIAGRPMIRHVWDRVRLCRRLDAAVVATDDERIAAVCRAVPAIRYVKEETLPCGQHVARILAATGGSLDGVLGGAGARFVMDELARGACGTMPALEVADAHARL